MKKSASVTSCGNRFRAWRHTRIIYLIATNYILGFDEELKAELKKIHKHFVEADAAEAAKNGTLKEPVAKHFG